MSAETTTRTCAYIANNDPAQNGERQITPKGLEKAPWDEEERLQALRRLQVLDTPPEERFDRITRLVAGAFDVPLALISLIDRHRQWFKSACGAEQGETPREQAFCAHALHEPEIMVVRDARRDPRFCDHPLVTGPPHIRFYAGAVIQAAGRLPLGTLCIVDYAPRALTDQQRELLISLARLVESELVPPIADAQGRIRTQLAANIDPVTGFYTFAEFRDRAESLLSHAQNHGAPALGGCVLQVEMPQLDAIRRHTGMGEADRILASVAADLHACLSDKSAIFGRHGSNAIAAVLAGPIDPQALIEELRPVLSTIRPRRGAAPLCAYLGQSMVSSSFDDAWNQCLMAVESQRGQVGFAYKNFSEVDRARLDRACRIALALPGAIEHDQLQLCYQPKISVGSGKLAGFEALLRWQLPEPISPPEAFEAAAAINAVFALDQWVMKTACRQIGIWQQLGLTVVPIAINICCETLQDPAFVEQLIAELREQDLDPGLVQIEILETSAISNFDGIIAQLEQLKRHGIKLALDDFGTGYSSLGYLQRLPVDVVKMDISFIRAIADKQEDAKLAAGIVALAHGLGKVVIAEGVETEMQYFILEHLDCDLIQGHLFSRALSVGDTTQLLRSSKPFSISH